MRSIIKRRTSDRRRLSDAIAITLDTEAVAVGPRVIGPSAVVATSIGALALGALAVGSSVVGRLAVADAVIRRLRVEELEIPALSVGVLKIGGRSWPDDFGAGEAPPDQPWLSGGGSAQQRPHRRAIWNGAYGVITVPATA